MIFLIFFLRERNTAKHKLNIMYHITGCEGVVTLLGPTNFSVHHFFSQAAGRHCTLVLLRLQYIVPFSFVKMTKASLFPCDDDDDDALARIFRVHNIMGVHGLLSYCPMFVGVVVASLALSESYRRRSCEAEDKKKSLQVKVPWSKVLPLPCKR